MDSPTSPVLFYSTRGTFGCFSNFSRHPIVIDGKTWPTTEHYFQAQKFAGTEYEEKIRCLANPSSAAKEGRRRDYPLRRDWEAVKESVMRTALSAKFRQHRDLMEILLSTGQRELVEHTTNDAYWADGGDGSGRNRLGILLMELRETLK